MAETINILGDTPKQQWLNAINIYELCIDSNISRSIDYMKANDQHDDGLEGELARQLLVAKSELRNFADEMRRLVEGVFDE